MGHKGVLVPLQTVYGRSVDRTHGSMNNHTCRSREFKCFVKGWMHDGVPVRDAPGIVRSSGGCMMETMPRLSRTEKASRQCEQICCFPNNNYHII